MLPAITPTLPHRALTEARRGTPSRPRAVATWARRLASDSWLPAYAVGDLGSDVTALQTGDGLGDWVTALTGAEPRKLLRNPGKGRGACGGRYFASEDVALALVALGRLGANVSAGELTEPLRRRLSCRRCRPLLTPAALNVLWAPREDKLIHTARWPVSDGAPALPYALSLPDKRYVVGFGNPDGQRVEVVGRNRKLYMAVLCAGGALSHQEFRALLRSALPLECGNVVRLPVRNGAA